MKDQRSKSEKVTITIPLYVAETLQGLIDGKIGVSDSDEFTRQMKIVLKKLDKQVMAINQRINQTPET